jgi:hypothetical protein
MIGSDKLTKQCKFLSLPTKSLVSVGQTYFICCPDKKQENIEYHENNNQKINMEWIEKYLKVSNQRMKRI